MNNPNVEALNAAVRDRVNAMEPIVIELALLAISSKNTPRRVTKDLERLLDDLQWAAVEKDEEPKT